MRARTACLPLLMAALARDADGQTTPRAPVRPPEATACHSNSDCIVAAVEDEGGDGLCCPRCNEYEALNRTWAAQSSPCDRQKRGVCAMSCLMSNGPGPRAVCASQRCFLSYPPMASKCNADHDCTALPALLPTVSSDGCRIACGQYVFAAREDAAAVEYLHRDAHASGTCSASCVDRIPDTTCRANRCVPVDATPFRVRSATATAPTITGPATTVDVQSVVYRNLGQFASCSERPRAIRRTTSFAFELGFFIDGEGHVATVDTRRISANFPDIASCIESLMQKWQFARPLGARRAEVRYPVNLAFEEH
jgi:hypothetical protein